ncbi:MAG: hypothetical protein ACJAV5_002197 [Vicingaceae bacterium]|jgi:hypothetical protein
MNKNLITITFLAGITLLACTSPLKKEEQQAASSVKESSKAEQIVEASIKAHGGELYDKSHFRFNFRENSYRFENNNEEFEYEFKGLNKQGDSVRTLLTEKSINVWINNEPLDLNEKQKVSYSDNLNSVIYFATLPHKLKDNSVNKTYEGTTSIFNKTYEVIKVTFDQEGGGTDFDDEYYYWINAETNLMDYLAYNYQTNGGGVRFRAAYNPRKVGGIHFQDYINYKAEVGTPLGQLPKLHENDQLKEISRIETENIVEVKN